MKVVKVFLKDEQYFFCRKYGKIKSADMWFRKKFKKKVNQNEYVKELIVSWAFDTLDLHHTVSNLYKQSIVSRSKNKEECYNTKCCM